MRQPLLYVNRKYLFVIFLLFGLQRKCICNKLTKCSGCGTLRILCIMHHRNPAVWHVIGKVNLKDASGIQSTFYKFRWQKTDAEVVLYGRQDQIGSCKLDCRSEGKPAFCKVCVQKVTRYRTGGQAHPRILA